MEKADTPIFRWKSRHVDFSLEKPTRRFSVEKADTSIFGWKSGHVDFSWKRAHFGPEFKLLLFELRSTATGQSSGSLCTLFICIFWYRFFNYTFIKLIFFNREKISGPTISGRRNLHTIRNFTKRKKKKKSPFTLFCHAGRAASYCWTARAASCTSLYAATQGSAAPSAAACAAGAVPSPSWPSTSTMPTSCSRSAITGSLSRYTTSGTRRVPLMAACTR